MGYKPSRKQNWYTFVPFHLCAVFHFATYKEESAYKTHTRARIHTGNRKGWNPKFPRLNNTHIKFCPRMNIATKFATRFNQRLKWKVYGEYWSRGHISALSDRKKEKSEKFRGFAETTTLKTCCSSIAKGIYRSTWETENHRQALMQLTSFIKQNISEFKVGFWEISLSIEGDSRATFGLFFLSFGLITIYVCIV